AIFSLVRNLGGSIGISLVQTMLVRNSIVSHASLVERITTSSPAWNNPAVASAYHVNSPGGAALLDRVITQQAAMIAYINDFWLMLFLTLLVTPLLLFIRPPSRASMRALDAPAVMD
ncbi:MAG: EmrB/QacA family drug resistance transporter, partial [Pseudomonadota bacterium]|nr:EmrB/QacA family drug resistance transporter [Pseudomonadota bacterium]